MKTFPKTSAFILMLHVAFCTNGQQELIPDVINHEISTCSVNSLAIPVTSSNYDVALSKQGSEFFSSLLDTRNWPARWQCGIWSPFHGWLYILSDVTIGISYFLIPLILLYYLKKHKHKGTFKLILTLFIVFILACGLTHFIDASIFWWPAYRLSALVRSITAIVSMGTVFALVKITPAILQLRSPDMLEKLVQERTTELTELTGKLHQEIERRKRVEDDLIRNEKQYRSLFESAAAGHLVADASGTIIMINARMEGMFGYENNTLIGQKVEVLIPDAIRIKHLEHRMTYAQHPKPRHMGQGMDLLGKRKDGSTFPIEISLNHYDSEDGIRVTAMAIDITERKNAAQKLIEGEKYYRSLIENISEAIV
ncbi:MAG: hypothetical protein C0490_26120, partial [Marivirga sp.]|nr:hypothetical protein [Marivirga sp.]